MQQEFGIYRYILTFDKRGRFVEKRSFLSSDRAEAIAYVREQSRNGRRTEETFNESFYNKY